MILIHCIQEAISKIRNAIAYSVIWIASDYTKTCDGAKCENVRYVPTNPKIFAYKEREILDPLMTTSVAKSSTKMAKDYFGESEITKISTDIK